MTLAGTRCPGITLASKLHTSRYGRGLEREVSVIVFQRLAKEGVLLTQSYTTPKCSPSRAALMTGLYPWRIGMQRGAIERCSMSMSHCHSQLISCSLVTRFQPDGLNTSLKLLPSYLQEAGYATHAVGKWHLGYCHPSYLPTRQGTTGNIDKQIGFRYLMGGDIEEDGRVGYWVRG